MAGLVPYAGLVSVSTSGSVESAPPFRESIFFLVRYRQVMMMMTRAMMLIMNSDEMTKIPTTRPSC